MAAVPTSARTHRENWENPRQSVEGAHRVEEVGEEECGWREEAPQNSDLGAAIASELRNRMRD